MVHFLILKCKISKIQKTLACGALFLNIHIFRFITDAGLQVDIDFDILAQGAVSFHPSVGTQTSQTHETAFFSIHLMGLESPSNYPVRASCVNVNKHGSY